MPIGPQIRGRVMNVVGETIDGMAELDRKGAFPIHREPPKFEDLATSQEVLFTGIKVSVLCIHSAMQVSRSIKVSVSLLGFPFIAFAGIMFLKILLISSI